MQKIGWSGKEWHRKMKERMHGEMEKEVERIPRDVQGQEWNEALEKSKCAKQLKVIIGRDRGIYENKKK